MGSGASNYRLSVRNSKNLTEPPETEKEDEDEDEEEEPLDNIQAIPIGEAGQEKPDADLTGILNTGYIAEHYIFSDTLLGRSANNLVRVSTHKRSRVIRALKQHNLTGEGVDIRDIKKEVALLREVRSHQNIIRLYEVFIDKVNLYEILEFCAGLRLFDYIMDAEYHTEQETATVLHQIVKAVEFMHGRLICHRDIKPEHVLTKEAGSIQDALIKIVDFKTACEFVKPGQVHTERVGTPWYSSPQVHNARYTEACDMWSCGVIMYLMMLGYPEDARRHLESNGPTKGKEVIHLLRGRFEFSPHDWASTSPGASELLAKLLVDRETERLSAKAAVAFHWLARQAPQPLGSRTQVSGDGWVGLEQVRVSPFADHLKKTLWWLLETSGQKQKKAGSLI
eukprot:TRINITY_DN21145_c0_g1_i1.p1 TRINITY_DN21145_c0_g1~~TRINITY_DN21145_c0_g1_i1.p1  ORF type:complete len:406 (+),score=59.01 TRINITY_DN21145_c0_g1_i1:34-1218(+)